MSDNNCNNELCESINNEKIQYYNVNSHQHHKPIRASLLSTDVIYCTGDTFLQGLIRTPLRLTKGILFPDGDSNNPSIAFDSNHNTGVYKTVNDQLSLTAGGTPQLNIGTSGIQLNNQITTLSGNLILNPAGPSIDFTGHSIIGLNGVSITVGQPNNVLINDANGNMTGENRLAVSRGGTGIDTSNSVGIPIINNGLWSVQFISDAVISSTAAIARNKIAGGTNNYVIINDASGKLTEEQYLSQSRGGTGINTSASNGIPHINSGQWVVGSIIDNDISTSANISRSKIHIGSSNYVIINDLNGNLSEEQYLAPARGGTGMNSGTMTGVVKINNGVWGTSLLSDSDFGNLTNLSINHITTSNISSVNDIIVNSATNTLFMPSITHQIPMNIPGGDSITYTANIVTTNSASVILFTLPTVAGVYTIRSLITLVDSTGGVDTGSYSFIVKAKNIGGAVTVSNAVNQYNILDGSLSNTSFNINATDSNINVNVNGLINTNIKWMSRFDIISQQF